MPDGFGSPPAPVELAARFHEGGARPALHRGTRIGRHAGLDADHARVVAEQDPAREIADLDSHDAVALRQGLEPLAELANAAFARPVR